MEDPWGQIYDSLSMTSPLLTAKGSNLEMCNIFPRFKIGVDVWRKALII